MDSLFDEEIDEVGAEIEAYCPGPRCKADTHHTIVSMYEDEVRRVQCSVCSDVHPYRKPRGEAVDESADSSSRRATRKPTWAEAMGQVTDQELARCRPYSIRDTYKELDVVAHPTFDVGFVTELLPDNKVEVTFKDERRVLVHNRADLAAKMPGIADLPAPRPEKRRKKRKKAKAPAAAPVEETPPTRTDEAALAQAKAAKREAVERAAEAKRKLTTQLAAERIKALRGSDDAPSAPRAGARRARGAKSARVSTAKSGSASRTAERPTSAKAAKVAKAAAPKPKPKAKTNAAPSPGGKAAAAGVKTGAKKTVAAAPSVKLGAKKKAIQPATGGTSAVKSATRRGAATAAARTARTTSAKTGPAAKAKAAAPARAAKKPGSTAKRRR